MNWGKNLTMNGAIDQDGWVTLGTQWTVATAAAVTTLLDRLLHHAHVLKCGPRSWRTSSTTASSPPSRTDCRSVATCDAIARSGGGGDNA